MTMTALLFALSAPVVCAAGWYNQNEAAESCSDCCCDGESQQGSSQADRNSTCPLAGMGVCTGLIFLVTDSHTLALIDQTVRLEDDLIGSCPSGFVDELIQPPNFIS